VDDGIASLRGPDFDELMRLTDWQQILAECRPPNHRNLLGRVVLLSDEGQGADFDEVLAMMAAETDESFVRRLRQRNPVVPPEPRQRTRQPVATYHALPV
jgi:hypothetical protein